MLITTFASFHAMLSLVGCKPAEQAFCERLDECNALDLQSVSECANDVHDSLKELSDSDEKDCRTAIDNCLENESCDNFAVCVLTDASPKCGTAYLTTVTGTTPVTPVEPPGGGGGGGGGGGATECELGAQAFCLCVPYAYTTFYCDDETYYAFVAECENGGTYGPLIECFADYVDEDYYVDCYSALTYCG